MKFCRKKSAATKRKRERGSHTTEFVLVLPLIIAAAVGAVDFGRAMWAFNAVEHVAQEAVRHASVRSSTSSNPINPAGVTAYVKDHVPGFNPDQFVVDTTWEPSNVRGAIVSVQVDYEVQPMIPLWPRETMQVSTIAFGVVSN